MTKSKNKPVVWILVEEKTDARDGIFTSKADAEIRRGYRQAEWTGSSWELVSYYPGDRDGLGTRDCIQEPMYSRLTKLYGEANYEAIDRYCESLESK